MIILQTSTLMTFDLETIQNTDVGDAVTGIQWHKTSTITAMTLPTVDSARVILIDPKRIAKNKSKYKSHTLRGVLKPYYFLEEIIQIKIVMLMRGLQFSANLSHLAV